MGKQQCEENLPNQHKIESILFRQVIISILSIHFPKIETLFSRKRFIDLVLYIVFSEHFLSVMQVLILQQLIINTKINLFIIIWLNIATADDGLDVKVMT